MLTTSRRLWWGIPLLLLLLACLGALVPQLVSPLPQAPALTSVALPVVRFVRDIAAALTVGCVIVGGLVAPGGSPRVLSWSTRWGLVWLVALVAQTVLTFSDILAVGIGDSLDATALWSFLSSVTAGQVLAWQALAVLLVILLARAVISLPTAWLVTVIALTAAALPSLLGHGGLDDSHVAATISLALHLAAVSIWLGGLAAAVALVRGEPAVGPTVLPRFSAVALVCVLVVAESGLLNASLRLSSPSSLLGSDYGGTLMLKAVALVFLVQLGWTQRRRVLPALTHGPASSADLMRVAGWEFLAMGAAVGIGVTMSRIGIVGSQDPPYVINPLTLVVIGAALPALVARMVRVDESRRWVGLACHYPEFVAVGLAVIIIEVAGIALPSLVMGPDLGVVVGALLLGVVGWVMAVALRGQRPGVGRAAAVAAWTVAMGAVYLFERARSGAGVDLRLYGVALVVAIISVLLTSSTGHLSDDDASSDQLPVGESRG